MNPSVVVLVPCADYDRETVHACVRQGLTLLGGLGQFVQP